MSNPIKCAYADPPYLGCGRLYKKFHENAKAWDDPRTHAELIERLCDEYTDGWAMSLTSTSLKTILAMCPDDVRIGAWVKPFCSFKPGVGVAYAWEPVIFRGGRKRNRKQDTVRDFVQVNITLQKGLPGAKPKQFCYWVFDLLNLKNGDTLVDIFPGTGIVSKSFEQYINIENVTQLPLFQ